MNLTRLDKALIGVIAVVLGAGGIASGLYMFGNPPPSKDGLIPLRPAIVAPVMGPDDRAAEAENHPNVGSEKLTVRMVKTVPVSPDGTIIRPAN